MANVDLSGLNILILEDEPLLRKQLASRLEKLGCDVVAVETVTQARQLIRDLSFDLALLDVNLPDGLGTDLLRERVCPEHTAVVIMTAQGNVNGAVEAIRAGAVDYLVKPFDAAELPLILARVHRSRQAARAREQRRQEVLEVESGFYFGASLRGVLDQMQRILEADRRISGPLPPVLIEGETGTGKTTIARSLHHQGPRAGEPLIEVNCSAFPESLAESELFGHEKGAFTDARSARMGLFEAASGGTLFLDELPSLSLALQAKVLTVLEDHRLRRVGGNKAIPIDVRVIAATNRDLKELVACGKFREDLYHRLDLYRIHIPPLRERGVDILELAEKLVTGICRRHRVPKRTFTEAGKYRLRSYAWPGNVRELAHELERAVVFGQGTDLSFENLRFPGEAHVAVAGPGADWFNGGYVFPEKGFSLPEAINRVIHHALKQTNNNVSAAARLLGVPRDYVRYRLDQGAEGLGNSSQ